MSKNSPNLPRRAIHVAERGTPTAKEAVRCEIGENVAFSTESLESYFFARWEPVAYDALLLAGAVEFADRTQKRSAHTWQRDITLHVPVHDPDRWRDRRVSLSLADSLDFLTGDRWHIQFRGRRRPVEQPQQGLLSLQADVHAVIPFSDGLDSCAVAALKSNEMGGRLVRVRLGSTARDGEMPQRQAFTSVPYKVRAAKGASIESSVRSRGFKFALISGIAAYLANAGQVIVPESGQGALGPTLVAVGHAYGDYRSHPLFTRRMERFLEALLGQRLQYVFPQIWQTKAETLKRFVDECRGDASWSRTWSCWQQNRHVSVDHKKRQCGICAACMLRRLSVHAAGLTEPRERYVWEDLSASAFAAGAAASFPAKRMTTALHEYAIAGTLHLDHLAGLPASRANAGSLDLAAFQLGDVLGQPMPVARANLDRLLNQHRIEWGAFIGSLGQNSFVADWAVGILS